MAQSEHLPIYKASYDLCLYFEQVVHGFSRYHTPGASSCRPPVSGRAPARGANCQEATREHCA